MCSSTPLTIPREYASTTELADRTSGRSLPAIEQLQHRGKGCDAGGSDRLQPDLQMGRYPRRHRRAARRQSPPDSPVRGAWIIADGVCGPTSTYTAALRSRRGGVASGGVAGGVDPCQQRRQPGHGVRGAVEPGVPPVTMTHREVEHARLGVGGADHDRRAMRARAARAQLALAGLVVRPLRSRRGRCAGVR